MAQVSIKYTIIFYCKTLNNLANFGFCGLKTNHLATLLRFVVRCNGWAGQVHSKHMSTYVL
jgi:hypothetical protein